MENGSEGSSIKVVDEGLKEGQRRKKGLHDNTYSDDGLKTS